MKKSFINEKLKLLKNNNHSLLSIGRSILTSYLNENKTDNINLYIVETDNKYGTDLGKYYNYKNRVEIDRDTIFASVINDKSYFDASPIGQYAMFKDYIVDIDTASWQNEIDNSKEFSAQYFQLFKNFFPYFYSKLKSSICSYMKLNESKYDLTFYKLYSNNHIEIKQMSYFKQINFNIPETAYEVCEEAMIKLDNEDKLFQPFVSFVNIHNSSVTKKRNRNKVVFHHTYTYFPKLNTMNIYEDNVFSALKNINEDNLPNLIYKDPTNYTHHIIIGNLFNNLLIQIKEKDTDDYAFILYNRYGDSPKFIKEGISIPHISNMSTYLANEIVGHKDYETRKNLDSKKHHFEYEINHQLVHYIIKPMCKDINDKLSYIISIYSHYPLQLDNHFKVDCNSMYTSFKNYHSDSNTITILSSFTLHFSIETVLDILTYHLNISELRNSIFDLILESLKAYKIIDSTTAYNKDNINDLLNTMITCYNNDSISNTDSIRIAAYYIMLKGGIKVVDEYRNKLQTFDISPYQSIKELFDQYAIVCKKYNEYNNIIQNKRKRNFKNVSLFGNNIDIKNAITQLGYYGNYNEFVMKVLDIE